MLLVEQNATMALGVADLAYVLDVGEVSLSGDARRARGDRRGAAPLPRARRRRGPRCSGRAPQRQDAVPVDGVTRAEHGAAAAGGGRARHPAARGRGRQRPLRRASRRCPTSRSPSRPARPRDHRPERRRQVDDVQRPVGRLQGRRGRRCASATHRADQMRPHQIAGSGGPRVPEHRAVGRADRRREPHARPPPPDQGRVPRRRAAAAAGHPRGQAARRARRGDRRVPRARRQAAHARSASCPTATRSASRSPGRCAPSPACCCSTSRSPA